MSIRSIGKTGVQFACAVLECITPLLHGLFCVTADSGIDTLALARVGAAFMDVYQGEDTVLRLYNETCFPEINVLCAGEAEKFTDTVEICGMYDKRTREFRFVSSQLRYCFQ